MAALLDKRLPLSEVRRLDARLSSLGRGQAALRLRVGELAEVLGVRGWFGEVGFSRVEDYALERCGSTVGWLRESRAVARKLAELPAMRAALSHGELSWSKAELCARKTTPERESEVLERAKTSTVRQMKSYFGKVAAESPMPDMQPEPSRWASWDEADQLGMCDEEGTGARCDEASAGAPVDLGTTCTAFASGGFASGAFSSGAFSSGAFSSDASGCAAPDTGASASRGEGGDPPIEAAVGGGTELDEDAACAYDRAARRTIQRTVPEAVVYKLEATRILLDHVESGAASPDAIMEAMLVEAQTKLEVDIDLAKMQGELQCADETRRKWLRTKQAMDEEAQASCESRLPDPEPADAILEAKPIPDTPDEIDAEIVGLCQTLATRDVEMGQLAEAIIVADGWRRMGLSSLRQYAQERVGVSQRTLEQKIKLARKVRQFPAMGEALQGGKINAEAALRISGIASEETMDAWIERAGRRTVKHLEEEIEAVRRLIRLGAPHDGGPPDESALHAAFEIERKVVSGELLKNNGDDSIDGDSDQAETSASARSDGPPDREHEDGGQHETTASEQRDGASEEGDGHGDERETFPSVGAEASNGDEYGATSRTQSRTCAAPCTSAMGAEANVDAGCAETCEDPSSVSGLWRSARTVLDLVTHAAFTGITLPNTPQMSEGAFDSAQMSGGPFDSAQMSGSPFAAPSPARGGGLGWGLSSHEEPPDDEADTTQMSGVADGASCCAAISAMPAGTSMAMNAEETADPGALLPKDPIDALLAARPWTLRFQLSQSNYIRWTALEKAYEAHAKVTGKSFLEFMLEAVWEVWGPRFQRTRAYQDIYVRDRYRCSNPVCRKRTLTPHHLVYRSHGGTDDPENVAALCFDCHILGVHQGRIAVAPPASNMRWVIGRTATLIVQGREVISQRPGAAISLAKPPLAPTPEAA